MKVQLIDSNLKYAYVITENDDRLKVALYSNPVGVYFVNEDLINQYIIVRNELAVEDYSHFEGFETVNNCEDCNGNGWINSNDMWENDQIQRCDTCKVFEHDHEAEYMYCANYTI